MYSITKVVTGMALRSSYFRDLDGQPIKEGAKISDLVCNKCGEHPAGWDSFDISQTG
jgi:hypothetical protein